MSWFLILAYINLWGLLGLSAAMQKHQKQLFARQLDDQQSKKYQVLGWLAILISCVLAVWHTNLSIGLSHILGIVTFNALFIAWCLNYYPKKLLKISAWAGVVFIVALIQFLFL